jgi:hypothetical protein
MTPSMGHRRSNCRSNRRSCFVLGYLYTTNSRLRLQTIMCIAFGSQGPSSAPAQLASSAPASCQLPESHITLAYFGVQTRGLVCLQRPA